MSVGFQRTARSLKHSDFKHSIQISQSYLTLESWVPDLEGLPVLPGIFRGLSGRLGGDCEPLAGLKPLAAGLMARRGLQGLACSLSGLGGGLRGWRCGDCSSWFILPAEL